MKLNLSKKQEEKFKIIIGDIRMKYPKFLIAQHCPKWENEILVEKKLNLKELDDELISDINGIKDFFDGLINDSVNITINNCNTILKLAILSGCDEIIKSATTVVNESQKTIPELISELQENANQKTEKEIHQLELYLAKHYNEMLKFPQMLKNIEISQHCRILQLAINHYGKQNFDFHSFINFLINLFENNCDRKFSVLLSFFDPFDFDINEIERLSNCQNADCSFLKFKYSNFISTIKQNKENLEEQENKIKQIEANQEQIKSQFNELKTIMLNINNSINQNKIDMQNDLSDRFNGLKDLFENNSQRINALKNEFHNEIEQVHEHNKNQSKEIKETKELIKNQQITINEIKNQTTNISDSTNSNNTNINNIKTKINDEFDKCNKHYTNQSKEIAELIKDQQTIINEIKQVHENNKNQSKEIKETNELIKNQQISINEIKNQTTNISDSTNSNNTNINNIKNKINDEFAKCNEHNTNQSKEMQKVVDLIKAQQISIDEIKQQNSNNQNEIRNMKSTIIIENKNNIENNGKSQIQKICEIKNELQNIKGYHTLHRYYNCEPFSGIISALTREHECNLNDHGIISISGNNHINSYGSFSSLVDFQYTGNSYRSEEPNPYICFDFKNYCIALSAYTIKSSNIGNPCHVRSWVIEGSNNGSEWSILDSHTNDCTVCSLNTAYTFKIKKETQIKYPFRFIRFKLTGPSSCGSYHIEITNFEFFGKMF